MKPWRGLSTVEDFQKYCAEHFAGMSRSEIGEADCAFYRAVTVRDLTDAVLPLSKKGVEWRKFTDEELVTHYAEHFSHLSRGQLQYDKIHGGSQLYHVLKRRGLLEEAIPETRHRWVDWDVDMFQAYCKEHFFGLSRGQVKEDGPDGRSFYKAVRARKLLDEVFPPSQQRFTHFTLEDAQRYYFLRLDGKSRGEVGSLDSGFMKLLRRNGWVDAVLPSPKKKRSRPNGFLRDFAHVEVALKEIIDQCGGVFPTTNQLKELDYGLQQALFKYHGGLVAVKARMGYSDELAALEELVEVLG